MGARPTEPARSSRRWRGRTGGRPGGWTEERDVEPSSGIFTGVWRRSTLEELDGWDEGWPVNQDCEMLGRIQESGGRAVLLRELGARYVPRDSLEGLARQYW